MTATAHDDHGPGVIAPPPLILLGTLLLGLGAQALRPLRLPQGAAWPRKLLGAALVGASLASGGWAARTMQGHKTNLATHKPATTLVEAGPYQRSRNPIYVSMTGLLAGIGLLANALWLVVLLPGWLVVMQRGVIEREERYLTDRFGAPYRAFCARVPRWL